MTTPLVSVVIPSYNHARYVPEAVESALAQVGCRTEVIVVDDGSTDNTREVLARFGDRIRYIFQENQGHSAARNTGIRAAQGEWIALLDADDYWHPQKTQRQLAALEREPTARVIGSAHGDEMPEELDEHPALRWLTVRDFLSGTMLTSSSTLVHRSAFEVAGLFDPSLKGAEDRDMWLRLTARVPVLQADLPCWHYRVHDQQTSRDPEMMYLHYRRMLDQFFAAHGEYQSLAPLAYAYLYHDAALAYCDDGQRGKALAFLMRSIARYQGDVCRGRASRLKLGVRLVFGDGTVRRLKSLVSRPSGSRLAAVHDG